MGPTETGLAVIATAGLGMIAYELVRLYRIAQKNGET